MSFNTRFNREYAGGSIGGILRKGGTFANGQSSQNAATGPDPRHVELLVFGYACKLFRDDEKARDIDHGKHLMSWMNDSSLKIDRYDVRGALYDLAPYEPPPGGYGNRLDYLSAEEQRAEQLCEEERYLYLYFNEEEHVLQQEEDLKRLQQESSGSAYGQVSFQYDTDACSGIPHGPNRDEFPNSPSGDEPEVQFVLPANFEVPPSIQLPETMKQHAIIEKTARFIASHGTQMEILLKAKQSNNVQFEFLNQNSQLNPYYKHMVLTMKDGKYPKPVVDAPAQDATDAADTALALSPVKTVVSVPTIKYKPSADCAYTQLISKIKGVPLPSVLDNENGTCSPVEADACNTPPPLQAPPEGSTKNSEENTNSNCGGEPQVEILKNSSALALAQDYLSDSEDEEEQHDEPAQDDGKKDKDVVALAKPPVQLNFPIPPESLQNIIDKTATYVIKNGRQFEETLRTKSEERFTFLLTDNEYYPYYMYKITGDPDAASKEEKTRKAAAVAAALVSKKGLLQDKTLSPVSFCIKPKEEIAATNLEASDEDDDNTQKKPTVPRNVPEHVQKAIKMVESQLMARNAQLAAVVLPPMMASLNAAVALTGKKSSSSSRFDIEHPIRNAPTSLSRSEKIEMERNALFEQQQQNRQKEIKKAEERVKDKLAQIAKEKLGGLLSKEKQLQLERKRKAMVFLNQIKGDSNTAAATDTTVSKSSAAESETGDANDSDASNVSVHSIPITSYGPAEKTDDEEEPMKELPYIPRTEQLLPLLAKPQLCVKTATATVTLSDDDDDDVQVVNETKPMTIDKSRQIRKHYRKRGRSDEHSEDSCSSTTSRSSSVSSTSSADDEPRHEKRSKRSAEEKSRRTEKRHRSSKSKTKKSRRRTRSPSRQESSYAVTKERSKSLRSRSRSPSRCSQVSGHRRERRKRSRSASRDSAKTRSRRKKDKKSKSKSRSRHDK